MSYRMGEQIKKGEAIEKRLDEFFSTWYEITQVNRRCQRNGIDRIWKCKETGRRFTVEYKADWTAASSGNIFIETISVDSENKPGWIYTSLAQLLVYCIPPSNIAYLVSMPVLKKCFLSWKVDYPLSPPVPNEGRDGNYNAFGILVPIGDFERDVKPCTRHLVFEIELS